MKTDTIVRRVLDITGHEKEKLFLLDGLQALELEGGKQHLFTIRSFVHAQGVEPRLSQHFTFTCGVSPEHLPALEKLAAEVYESKPDASIEGVSSFQTLKWNEMP